MSSETRRTFLGRGVAAMGLAAWAGRPAAAAATDPAELMDKAVIFLRPRQGRDGSWSGDRREPGITALVVTAMLRSGRVTPDDPAVDHGAWPSWRSTSARRAGSPRRPTRSTRPRSP